MTEALALSEKEKLLKFPCDYDIKAMGRNSVDFESRVIMTVRRHFSRLSEAAISTRTSKGGKFLSVTVRVIAKDQSQLNAVYADLKRDERILMAL